MISALSCTLSQTVWAGLIDDAVSRLSSANIQNSLDTLLYTHNGQNRGFTSGGPDIQVPTAQHDLARDNIFNHFQNLGFQTSLDPFTYTAGGNTYQGANNVIGILPGTSRADRYYILGGHYDSVGNPGADDNASGIAGIMEAARVLSGYSFEASLMFVAWDGEENGLKGSYHWVNTEDESVIDGVLNLDMIGYNHNGDNQATLYGSSGWVSKWQTAAQTYVPDLTINIYGTDLNRTDHWPFQNAGRPAGGIIENTIFPLPNPHYHSSTDSYDTANYLDYDYATDLLGTAVALMAQEAGIMAIPEPGTLVLLIAGLVLLAGRRLTIHPPAS